MSMQPQSEVDYKKQNNGSFKLKSYEKFLTIAGFAAAAVETFGIHHVLLSATTFAGEVGGGMALSRLLKPSDSIAKSAFLLLGGLGLGVVANVLPFSTLLHQATGAVGTAGAIGFIEIGIKKYKSLK